MIVLLSWECAAASHCYRLWSYWLVKPVFTTKNRTQHVMGGLLFWIMHQLDLVSCYLFVTPLPDSVCIGAGGVASKQRRPSCTDRRQLWKDWTSVCRLQCVPEERRGHSEDRNKTPARTAPSGPVYRRQRSLLLGPLWLTKDLYIHRKLTLHWTEVSK